MQTINDILVMVKNFPNPSFLNDSPVTHRNVGTMGIWFQIQIGKNHYGVLTMGPGDADNEPEVRQLNGLSLLRGEGVAKLTIW